MSPILSTYSNGNVSSRYSCSDKRLTRRSSARFSGCILCFGRQHAASSNSATPTPASSTAATYHRARMGSITTDRVALWDACPCGTQNAAASVMRCDSCSFPFCQARNSS